jgi:hypothetical protein
MAKIVRLTESDLTRLVNTIIKEQSMNAKKSYTFPIDVVITDGSIFNAKKITIPKGSVMNYGKNGMGQVKVGNTVITYDPNENETPAESYGLTLRVNNQPFILQWADSALGIVYNKEYQRIGNSI